MVTKKNHFIQFLLLMLSVTSCRKFLQVDTPASQVVQEVAFSDDITATAAVTGIYNRWMTISPSSFMNGGPESITALLGLSADELHFYDTDASTIQFESNQLMADNGLVLGLWNSMYYSIYQANAIIEGLRNSELISAATKKQLTGEALFIRAFTHFYLLNLFGDVPLVTSTNYKINALLPRTLTVKVYDQIIEDLRGAEDSLSNAYPTVGKIRPNKATATAMLARVYLFRKDWVNAEAEASKIISSSQYKLEPNLNRVFLAHTSANVNSEAIWQLLPIISGYNTNEGAYFLKVSVSGLYNKLLPNFIASFEPNDRRRSEWIKTSGALYLPYKYKVEQSTTITENKMVFRLAETYLIRAEARAQQNKLLGVNGAASDIDSIRIRAGLSATPASTKAALLAAVEQERRVELFTEEGHRWLDLKRWDRASSVLSPLKPAWGSTDMLYPLPETELIKNINLRPQNPGY